MFLDKTHAPNLLLISLAPNPKSLLHSAFPALACLQALAFPHLLQRRIRSGDDRYRSVDNGSWTRRQQVVQARQWLPSADDGSRAGDKGSCTSAYSSHTSDNGSHTGAYDSRVGNDGLDVGTYVYMRLWLCATSTARKHHYARPRMHASMSVYDHCYVHLCLHIITTAGDYVCTRQPQHATTYKCGRQLDACVQVDVAPTWNVTCWPHT